MSLSSITVSGTIKKDPEKRFTPTNIPVTNLMLEICYVSRGSASQPSRTLSSQVVRVNAWRDLAEECERKLKAGDKVLVIGKSQINAYTTNEGKKKREIEIDASSVTLLNDVLSIQAPPSTEQPEKSQSSLKKSTKSEPVESFKSTPAFEEVVSSTEEIPF